MGASFGACGGSPMAACCTQSEQRVAVRTQLDEEFGHGVSEALDCVCDALGFIQGDFEAGRPLAHPLLVNLALIFKQVDQENRYPRPPTSGERFKDAKVIRRAARYARYASAAYHTDKVAIADCISGMHDDDVKYVHVATPSCNSDFFVAVDPVTSEIVLCLRGAASAYDALVEAICIKEDFLDGRAHSGMLEVARQVAEIARKALSKLMQSTLRSIAIVGHSVGAAVAILTTILLCSQDGASVLRNMMSIGKVKCYAFAPPPTFEPLSKLPRWVHTSTYTFVHSMDCVPRACMGTMGRLMWAVGQVDALPMTTTERLSFLHGDYELEHKLPDFAEVPKGMREKLGSLFGIGTIILLYRDRRGEACCEKIDANLADRLLLHPDMAKDHEMNAYQIAMTSAFPSPRHVLYSQST